MKPKEPNLAQRGLLFQKTIQDAFEAFLELNPHFYPEFVRLARELKEIGLTRLSADYILHYMRIDTTLKLRKVDAYRCNDHWTSRLARLVDSREPDLRGMFELRKLKSA